MKGWVRLHGFPYFDCMRNLESQMQNFEALMETCHEKDNVITKLQEAMDQNSEASTRDVSKLFHTCTCINGICGVALLSVEVYVV
jgi:hypothetical protein